MTVSDDEDGVILKRRKLYNVVKDESDDEENHITGLKSSIVKAEEGDEETKDAKLVNTDNDSPNSDDLEENVSDDLEEDYKWWEEQDKDDTIKWTTLEHNGVLFPPPYEALPSHVKLYYEGNPVDLPLEAEEVAGFLHTY